jgi:nicotinamidase-related amidase
MSTLLHAATSQLMVVDVQERLAPAVHDHARLIGNVRLLLAAAARLGVPVTVTEQYRKGLGTTIAAVREALPPDAQVYEKLAFSAIAEADIAARVVGLSGAERRTVVICGAEAHVCVLQTAFGALETGARVVLVADATGSRAPFSHATALERARAAGIDVVTTEMAVFEWLGRAGTDDFRALQPLLKG